jgi:hypothetical protein
MDRDSIEGTVAAGLPDRRTAGPPGCRVAGGGSLRALERPMAARWSSVVASTIHQS